ncbi:alpha/beta hydrolase [Limosilactobacillus oris]|uniref:alpha/beta hydrolase n=1 Tax=Limosilactobacillus oris TaxID=1632 RepID=UPI002659197A|nr:alpha/beta hydrolase [Limosilactobacillus oris]
MNKGMVTIKKFLKGLGLVIASVIVIGGCVQLYLLRGTPGRPLREADLRADTEYSTTPTLLIPGWGGSTVTYDKMINYYQSHHLAQKVLTIWVSPWGSIRVSGHLSKNQKNPLIQVLYDWNYNQTFHPQVKQLTAVLTYLQDHYNLHQVNVIAHSYGGTEFMHAYLNSPALQSKLKLHKLIFLGVPVEESLSARLDYHYHLIHHSHDQNFLRLRRQMQTWRPDYPIMIYNIMGTKPGSTRTDGAVPLIQAEMLRSLVKGHPTISYLQKIYPNTTHSQLHARKAIFHYVAHQLWGKDDSE